MTADELRDLIKKAGGRGSWEYYRATDQEMTITVVADYAEKTWTFCFRVAWAELAARRAGAGTFETVELSRLRDRFAYGDLKLKPPQP